MDLDAKFDGHGDQSRVKKIRIQLSASRVLCGTHNDFSEVGGGLRRGRILIRNRDGWVESMVPTVVLHPLTLSDPGRMGGVGRGQGSTYRAKNA